MTREEQIIDHISVGNRGILEKAKVEERIICIYTDDSEPTKFSVGFIRSVFHDTFIMKHIESTGKADGFIAGKIEDIYLIETETKYLKKVQKLWEMQAEKADNAYMEEIEKNAFKSLLTYAMKHKKIVSIELLHSGFTDILGNVVEIKGQRLFLNTINEIGESNGEAVALLEDITHLSCDGSEEMKIALLQKS